MAIQRLSVYNRSVFSFSPYEIESAISDIAHNRDTFLSREFTACLRREYSNRRRAIESMERENQMIDSLNGSQFIGIVYCGDWQYLSRYLGNLTEALRVMDDMPVYLIRRVELYRLPKKFFKVWIR